MQISAEFLAVYVFSLVLHLEDNAEVCTEKCNVWHLACLAVFLLSNEHSCNSRIGHSRFLKCFFKVSQAQQDEESFGGESVGTKKFELNSTDSVLSTLPVLLVKMSTFLTPMIYGFFNPQVCWT